MTVLKHALPRPHIGYHEAMMAWFTLADGSVHNVQTCNSMDFWTFLSCCSMQRKGFARVNMRGLVTLIDEDDCALTRWHCLEELREGYVKLPLYESEEDAKIALMSYTTE